MPEVARARKIQVDRVVVGLLVAVTVTKTNIKYEYQQMKTFPPTHQRWKCLIHLFKAQHVMEIIVYALKHTE